MILTKNLLHTTDVYIKKLKEAWIETIADLAWHFPRAYENKSNILEHFSFANLKEKNAISCTIETIWSERTRNNKIIIKAILRDKWWFLCEAVWFNKKFMLNKFSAWDEVMIFGKPTYWYWKLSFPSPDIEHISSSMKDIKPIYPELNYIPSEWFEKKMLDIRHYFSEFEDTLPQDIIKKKWFSHKSENLRKIHFPKNIQEFEEARKELAYEELFRMQHEWMKRKKDLEVATQWKSPTIPMDSELVKDIISKLPFPLTWAQKIVIFQILKDMEKPHAAKRLLQWDVWTWKTVVALITTIHAILKWDIQVAIMVPTEILARQHFDGMQEILMMYWIKSDILVWSLTWKQKDEAKARLKNWETQIIIWTHALIQDDVQFFNLWYVIIDEQHRFWVEQRKALEQYYSGNKWRGWYYPHNLNMTATPIPRTLAMTIYGDQDISVINEYPAWRLPIYTKVIKEEDRNKMYTFLEQELKSWRQAYWISPLVEESETLDIASATQMREYLESVFESFNIWLLHWKMRPKEKDQVMNEFMEWGIDILSSTSVVEVWVNNQNATIMCIEAAERFWLSQLHQFRWRVWRWEHQSYCYLFTTKTYKWDRLKAMEKTNNWFELSEIDLELRWPWEVYWVRQSWLPDFKIADLKDLELISEIREDIENMINK